MVEFMQNTFVWALNFMFHHTNNNIDSLTHAKHAEWYHLSNNNYNRNITDVLKFA